VIIVNCAIVGLNAIISLLHGLWVTFSTKTVVLPRLRSWAFCQYFFPPFCIRLCLSYVCSLFCL